MCEITILNFSIWEWYFNFDPILNKYAKLLTLTFQFKKIEDINIDVHSFEGGTKFKMLPSEVIPPFQTFFKTSNYTV